MKNMYIRRIEEIRDGYGFSSEKMANRCSMKPKYFRKMISDDKMPKLETIEKICNGMGISLAQFYASSIFGEETIAQQELMKLYVSLDPENKRFLLKMAEELKQTQDERIEL